MSEPVSCATKQCVKCLESKSASDFDVLNKTGKSKLCKLCRKKRNDKVRKQRVYKYQKLVAKAKQETKVMKEQRLAKNIKQLQKDFRRFTLSNRVRLGVLIRSCERKSNVAKRTREAIEHRTKLQQQAEAILQYQIELTHAGIKPQHITVLWRDRHGTNARKQSQIED